SRPVPGTGREAWDTEVDARPLLGSPSPRHAGKSAPRSLEPTWVTVYDPDVGYLLALQAERSRKSALASANDQHIEDRGTVPIARHRPLPRGIAQIRQLAPHPIREPGNAHGPRLLITAPPPCSITYPGVHR